MGSFSGKGNACKIEEKHERMLIKNEVEIKSMTSSVVDLERTMNRPKTKKSISMKTK